MESIANITVVGTTVGAIIALLVCSGGNKVPTRDAFTMFENNTGWSNSTHTNISNACEPNPLIAIQRWLGFPLGIHCTHVDAHWL